MQLSLLFCWQYNNFYTLMCYYSLLLCISNIITHKLTSCMVIVFNVHVPEIVQDRYVEPLQFLIICDYTTVCNRQLNAYTRTVVNKICKYTKLFVRKQILYIDGL